MKITTDLKAGVMYPGHCTMKVNRLGMCKKILCPFPPYKFPCYRTDLLGPIPYWYASETGGEAAGATADRLR